MSDHPDPERIDEAAAAWVVRSDRGLTPKEQDDFLEWLAGDPRHGAALARYRQDWARLDALSDWRPRHGAQPNPDLLAPRTRPPRVLRWVIATTVAAAAAALVVWLVPQYTP